MRVFRPPTFFGDAVGRHFGGQSAGFQDQDFFAFKDFGGQARRRHASRFSRAGRGFENERAILRQPRNDVGQEGIDGEGNALHG